MTAPNCDLACWRIDVAPPESRSSDTEMRQLLDPAAATTTHRHRPHRAPGAARHSGHHCVSHCRAITQRRLPA
jgi:hypothetical protein